ncbi:MAG: ferredoxin [Candidatus Gracilibacteria bacterium]|jgi:ferredoxin
MQKKVFVDIDVCIGCTLCTQMCPKVFAMKDDGKSHVSNPVGDTEKRIQTAIDACPVNCIHWKSPN